MVADNLFRLVLVFGLVRTPSLMYVFNDVLLAVHDANNVAKLTVFFVVESLDLASEYQISFLSFSSALSLGRTSRVVKPVPSHAVQIQSTYPKSHPA